MAQKNVTIAGNQYPTVPSIEVPITGGGTASFVEISDTTAAASDVAQGKYFYTSAGVKTAGTATGGGGGTGQYDFYTILEASNGFAPIDTYDDIYDAFET